MAAPAEMNENIRKYEEIGTHPGGQPQRDQRGARVPPGIGGERKVARLRYLRDRWAKPLLAESDRVQDADPARHRQVRAASGCCTSTGSTRGSWADGCIDQYKIVTTPIVHPEFNGIRVTPNVYTTPAEVDTFTDAMRVAIRSGVA